MSHDKVKAASRKRMTATGERYAAARRQDTNEYKAARFTSPVSGDDILAAAEVHRELGPDYSDAVVASFIDKVERAVAARVEARLADVAQPKPAKPLRRGQRRRRVARDVLAASAGALVAVGAVGLHEITSPHPAPPVSSSQRALAEVQLAAPWSGPPTPVVTMLFVCPMALRDARGLQSAPPASVVTTCVTRVQGPISTVRVRALR